MRTKRVTLLCGHYGSGKTNIAVNLAYRLRAEGKAVAIADLDIVNPYFRTKDSEEDFKKNGIDFICSPYANSNLDIPALPQEMYAIVDNKSRFTVVDVGGDDRGALALGRLTPAILAENDYECIMVVNSYRPLTRTAEETLAVMREIEYASGIPFTAIVNNSNLGEETTPEVVLSSLAYAESVAALSGLPVIATAVREDLAGPLTGKIENLLPLRLQSGWQK